MKLDTWLGGVIDWNCHARLFWSRDLVDLVWKDFLRSIQTKLGNQERVFVSLYPKIDRLPGYQKFWITQEEVQQFQQERQWKFKLVYALGYWTKKDYFDLQNTWS